MSTPTAGGDSNLDNIIKKNFPTEIQQRRVKLGISIFPLLFPKFSIIISFLFSNSKIELKYLKELDQNCYKISLQSSPLGLKIIVKNDFALLNISL